MSVDVCSDIQEAFFGDLHDILMEIPEVTELHPVPDAHVPVMKFKFRGISIDLLYAQLSLWVVPEVRITSVLLNLHQGWDLFRVRDVICSPPSYLCVTSTWIVDSFRFNLSEGRVRNMFPAFTEI